MNYVYVLDQRENPLMPTKRYGWLRRALKSGKAKAGTTIRNRLLPGATFVYQGKPCIMTGQLTGGRYFWAAGYDKKNFPARNSLIVRQNQGLVYV